MALACPDRSTFARTNVHDDWPGLGEFKQLGRLRHKVLVKSGTDSITVGIFESADGSTLYVASTRPHVVGMGSGFSEALDDWLLELQEKWALTKSLRRPFAPAVENDFEAMGKFFGVILDGSGNAQD